MVNCNYIPLINKGVVFKTQEMDSHCVPLARCYPRPPNQTRVLCSKLTFRVYFKIHRLLALEVDSHCVSLAR